MRRAPRYSTTALLIVTCATMLGAQHPSCPGLPSPEPPKLEDCKGGWREALQALVKTGCRGNNEKSTARYERMMHGFTTGLDYKAGTGMFLTGLDLESRMVTTDSLRGCKGDNVNLEFTPGNVSVFQYELSSPSNVVVSSNRYETWEGTVILGDNITLPETGYYTLRTTTIAPVQYYENKDRRGHVERTAYYPREFHIGFRSDASLGALIAGDKVDATINSKQPFIRKLSVKGGSRVRVRFASQGTGAFLVSVRRESGEELYRNAAPTGYYETNAITPKADEQFRVEVRPWMAGQSAGLQVSVIEDKSTSETVTATSHVTGAFKLPAHFFAAAAPAVAASETVRYLYQATGAENITAEVKPSQLAGLAVKVRVYNQESEEVTLRSPILTTATTLAVPITGAGTWIVEVAPVSAADLTEAGEAKYVIQFAHASANATPADTTRKARKRPE